MLVRQYVCFTLTSSVTSAAEMAAVLGIEPDRAMVRGSRRAGDRPVPVAHGWIVECRDAGLTVDEQVARLLKRLAPHIEAIAALARCLDAEPENGPSAGLEVVRYYCETDENEAGEDTSRRVLGWHLGRDVLDFLQAVGAGWMWTSMPSTPSPEGARVGGGWRLSATAPGRRR